MKSFVPVKPESDFSIYNLPYGVFSTPENEKKRIGVAIGEYILDLHAVADFYPAEVQDVLKAEVLNPLMAMDRQTWHDVRIATQNLLLEGSSLDKNSALKEKAIISQNTSIMHLPANIGDYTDFYSSIHHAQNCGEMFRSKENALTANWKHLPVGYHGRASSVVISGTPITRPLGQTLPVDGAEPYFGPCRLLDFELEMAFYIGGRLNKLGERVSTADASNYIFGFSLMNDWSARDIQKWEYIPLGPFTAKNLGTTIGPWIVTVEALQPFLVDNFPQDPEPLPYLRHSEKFNFDINLEVAIKPANDVETTICQSNFKYLYWTPLQQLAHHSVTGCNLRPGDLMGSGTISGNAPNSFGSMLELSWAGKKTINLAGGKTRKFIEDGDEIILRGYSEKDGVRIGFGEAVGVVLPVVPLK